MHWHTPPAELEPRLQKWQYPKPSREVQLLLLAGVPPEHEGSHPWLSIASHIHSDTPQSCSALMRACLKAAPCVSCMQARTSWSVGSPCCGRWAPSLRRSAQRPASSRTPGSSSPRSLHKPSSVLDEWGIVLLMLMSSATAVIGDVAAAGLMLPVCAERCGRARRCCGAYARTQPGKGAEGATLRARGVQAHCVL